jgi:hypothetical protein
MKDIADKIYWLLIKEGQSHLCSIPLGQRMFFTPEDVREIIRNHKDELKPEEGCDVL